MFLIRTYFLLKIIMRKVLEQDLVIRKFEPSDWKGLVSILQDLNLRHDENTWESFMYDGGEWLGGHLVFFEDEIVAGGFLRPADYTEQWHTPYDLFMGGVFQLSVSGDPLFLHLFWDNWDRNINLLCDPNSHAYNGTLGRYRCVDIGRDKEGYAKVTRFKLNGPHH